MEEQIEYDREDAVQGDIQRIRFIFTGLIPSADTISTVAFYEASGLITEVTASRSVSGQVVSAFFDTSAGVVGTEYLIRCTIGSSSGVTRSLHWVLRILAGTPGTAVGASMNVNGSLYSAILTQTGTAAPVATVNANTFAGGNPTWSRVSEGIYRATLAGAFTSKIDLKASPSIDQGSAPFQTSIERIDNNIIELQVMDAGGNLVDVWGPIYVTIVVYT